MSWLQVTNKDWRTCLDLNDAKTVYKWHVLAGMIHIKMGLSFYFSCYAVSLCLDAQGQKSAFFPSSYFPVDFCLSVSGNWPLIEVFLVSLPAGMSMQFSTWLYSITCGCFVYISRRGFTLHRHQSCRSDICLSKSATRDLYGAACFLPAPRLYSKVLEAILAYYFRGHGEKTSGYMTKHQ